MGQGRIVIVSPALADANNGNWQTARRWQRLLAPAESRIVKQWPDAQASAQDTVMLALHARKSAASIAAWAERSGASANVPGLAVVLTGTDLYSDIAQHEDAQRSLQLASRLVVLQELGAQALPAALRGKTQTIFQSTTARQTLPKSRERVRAVMVGHLRAVKDPAILWAAARLLQGAGIAIDHLGDALEPALGGEARATAAACSHYRWLGGQAHEATRRRIQRAHVLVHTSRMEGGAHVIMEALRSGTPVLASRIDGNVGMLGADYPGYFEPGDAVGLAALLRRFIQGLREDASGDNASSWLASLHRHGAERAPLFAPEAERAALRQLVLALQS